MNLATLVELLPARNGAKSQESPVAGDTDCWYSYSAGNKEYHTSIDFLLLHGRLLTIFLIRDLLVRCHGIMKVASAPRLPSHAPAPHAALILSFTKYV
jgi:hypothetical protein